MNRTDSSHPRCLKITEKGLIQHGERSELRLHFEWPKMPNAKNVSLWRVFEKPEACCQTVLPDRSVLIGQKLVENAKNIYLLVHFEL